MPSKSRGYRFFSSCVVRRGTVLTLLIWRMDMEDKKFTNRIVRNLTAEELKSLYARLEDEQTPHSLTVHEGIFGMREIELRMEEEDISHFEHLLYSISYGLRQKSSKTN